MTVARDDSNVASADKNQVLGFLELVLGPESSNAACSKDTKVAPPNGRHQNTGDSGTDNHSSLKTDIYLHHKTKEKEEDHNGALSFSQVGAMDVNQRVRKNSLVIFSSLQPRCGAWKWPVPYSTFSLVYSKNCSQHENIPRRPGF